MERTHMRILIKIKATVNVSQTGLAINYSTWRKSKKESIVLLSVISSSIGVVESNFDGNIFDRNG